MQFAGAGEPVWVWVRVGRCRLQVRVQVQSARFQLWAEPSRTESGPV